MHYTNREMRGQIVDETDTFQLQNNYKIKQEIQQKNYVKNLEENYEELQAAFLQLTSQYARLQFRIRQLKQATPAERETLINDLNRLAFNDCTNNTNNTNNNINNNKKVHNDTNDTNECKGFPNEEFFCLERGNQTLNDIKRKQHQLIQQLRNQVNHLYDIRSLLNERLLSEQNNDEQNNDKQNTNARPRKLSKINSAYTRKSKSQSYVTIYSETNEMESGTTTSQNNLVGSNNKANRTSSSIQNKTKYQSNTL